jgi:hypothetical protein
MRLRTREAGHRHNPIPGQGRVLNRHVPSCYSTKPTHVDQTHERLASAEVAGTIALDGRQDPFVRMNDLTSHVEVIKPLPPEQNRNLPLATEQIVRGEGRSMENPEDEKK